MTKTHIVTDNGPTLPEMVSKDIPMITVPFYVMVGDLEIEDDKLSLSELAEYMERSKGQYPSTSAPNPSDFEQAYKLSMKSDEKSAGILVVTLSSKPSSSYANAVYAAKTFREQTGSEIPIEVVDSRGGTMTQGFLVMQADQMIKADMPLEEIAATLRDQATGDNLVFTCRETTYLHRSGRVGGIGHAVASMLRIKPIIALDDGEVGLISRVRGQKKAFSTVSTEVLKRSGGRVQKLAIIGGLDTGEGEQLVLNQILAGLESEPEQVLRTIMCPAMMVHMGPHVVGAVWV